jgi:hypothetical protein
VQGLYYGINVERKEDFEAKTLLTGTNKEKNEPKDIKEKLNLAMWGSRPIR